jgi:two-component system OmpR family response regulator
VATILVVDDDPNNCLLIATVLEPRGHRVRVAYSATDALSAIADGEPDLIVLDLSMPGGNGVDFLKALGREHRSTIVLYTATSPDAAMHDFMDLFNVRAVLEKPAEPARIVEVLEKSLSSRVN